MEKNQLALERITFGVTTNSAPIAESSAETLKRFGLLITSKLKL